jgi:thioredoxin reductase
LSSVYGAGDKGASLALMMKLWSGDVVLCTDGQEEVSSIVQQRLKAQGIAVYTEKVTKPGGTEDGHLHTIHLQSGKSLARNALFFTTGCTQRSDLSASLGCMRDEKGGIRQPSYGGE